MIVVHVPPDAAAAVLGAISDAGGGVVGEYTHCAFTNGGEGRFKPGPEANPHIGDKDTINAVPEVRIETFCDRSRAKAVAAAIRAAHPYEEPGLYLVPLLEEHEL